MATETALPDPREAVQGAITALEGRWSPAWIEALKVAAHLLPREVAWERDYGTKERAFRLKEIRLDGERTAGVGKAEDGSFLIRCTRPEEDGSRHEEAMCLSGQAMLALMYLYAKWEDIPWEEEKMSADPTPPKNDHIQLRCPHCEQKYVAKIGNNPLVKDGLTITPVPLPAEVEVEGEQ